MSLVILYMLALRNIYCHVKTDIHICLALLGNKFVPQENAVTNTQPVSASSFTFGLTERIGRPQVAFCRLSQKYHDKRMSVISHSDSRTVEGCGRSWIQHYFSFMLGSEQGKQTDC
jgi:hypothetical protein